MRATIDFVSDDPLLALLAFKGVEAYVKERVETRIRPLRNGFYFVVWNDDWPQERSWEVREKFGDLPGRIIKDKRLPLGVRQVLWTRIKTRGRTYRAEKIPNSTFITHCVKRISQLCEDPVSRERVRYSFENLLGVRLKTTNAAAIKTAVDHARAKPEEISHFIGKEMHLPLKKWTLQVEMVPSTAWGKNLRNLMSHRKWEELRLDVLSRYDNRCGICGAVVKPLECHEVWEYDDKDHIQRLLGFVPLCPKCHNIKHIGRSLAFATESKVKEADLARHFMTVNKCSLLEYDQHLDEAWSLWEYRSDFAWKLDLGDYKHMVSNSAMATQE